MPFPVLQLPMPMMEAWGCGVVAHLRTDYRWERCFIHPSCRHSELTHCPVKSQLANRHQKLTRFDDICMPRDGIVHE